MKGTNTRSTEQPAQPTTSTAGPTADELRKRAAETTKALKDLQRQLPLKRYAAEAGEPGAAEAPAETRRLIGECDDRLATLADAIKVAEERETQAKRSRMTALEVELPRDFQGLEVNLAERSSVLVSKLGASDDEIGEVYVLARQVSTFGDELSAILPDGKRFRRGWNLGGLLAHHSARAKILWPRFAKPPVVPTPWRAAVDELKALHLELGVHHQPANLREVWTIPESSADRAARESATARLAALEGTTLVSDESEPPTVTVTHALRAKGERS